MNSHEIIHDYDIKFIPLKMQDLKLLHGWLNSPYLLKIWSNGVPFTIEDVVKKYLPRINGERSVKCFLIHYIGRPIGMIQSYLWKDFPEESKFLQTKERSAGSLDMFIGEEDFRGSGYGPRIIRKFLSEILFLANNTDSCIITPHVDNPAALRAYEKVGFKRIRIVNDENEPWSPIALMRLDKKDLNSRYPV